MARYDAGRLVLNLGEQPRWRRYDVPWTPLKRWRQ
jgi:hypothetical protein